VKKILGANIYILFVEALELFKGENGKNRKFIYYKVLDDDDFLLDLKNIYNSYLDLNYEYITEEVEFPERVFTEIKYNSSKILRSFISNSQENFINVYKGKTGNYVYFDSLSERTFHDIILNNIAKYKGKLYTKVYTDSSMISYKYKNKVNGIIKISSSYPDFIFRLGKKTFVIEIKSESDYDPQKTKSIEAAYEEISKQKGMEKYYFGLIIVSDNKKNYK